MFENNGVHNVNVIKNLALENNSISELLKKKKEMLVEGIYMDTDISI